MVTLRDMANPSRKVWWVGFTGCLAGLLIGLAVIPVRSAPDPNALKVQGPDTIGNLLPVQIAGGSSTGSTQTMLAQSSANAAGTNNVSLGGAAGLTTYVTGFQITGGGATAASVITITLTGVVTQTQNYQLVIPAGATTSITPLIVTFPTPVPASATNTSITLNVPSFGAGNTNAAAAIQGFRQ